MSKDKENQQAFNRREFLRILGVGTAGVLLSGMNIKSYALPQAKPPTAQTPAAKLPDLVVTEGKDAAKITRMAIEQLGGMQKFVSKGDLVVVKPNIGWDRLAAQAADTNPEVVKAVVEMAYEAGAKKVKVFDHTINDSRACYQRSGIAEAARAAGADVSYVNPQRFKKMKIKGAQFLKECSIYTEALECDCLINVPIAKTHSTSKLTMAIKNHMGLVGSNRALFHQNIDQSLAELATVIRPQLTVLDAYKVMIRNGPSGGSLKDVQFIGKCVASADQVAVDAYGATLFNMKPEDLGYVRLAHKFGLGEMNLSRLSIKEVKTS